MSGNPTVYQPPPNGWRTFLIIWGTQSASVFGSAMTLFAMNIWLTQTPHELQGRVFAVHRLIAQFTWPLSAALAGWRPAASILVWSWRC